MDLTRIGGLLEDEVWDRFWFDPIGQAMGHKKAYGFFMEKKKEWREAGGNFFDSADGLLDLLLGKSRLEGGPRRDFKCPDGNVYLVRKALFKLEAAGWNPCDTMPHAFVTDGMIFRFKSSLLFEYARARGILSAEVLTEREVSFVDSVCMAGAIDVEVRFYPAPGGGE